MRNRLSIVSAGACVLALSACGSAAAPGSPHTRELQARGIEMAAARSGVDYTQVARGTRQLGYQLTTSLADAKGNVVVSPASLSLAFVLAREGATGESAREIDKVFGFSADRRSAYNSLLHQLADTGGNSVLQTSNAAFLDRGYPVKHSYLAAIKRWYGAGLFVTEYPEQAVIDINRYVDQRTSGRIPRLLDKLDPFTVFTLVNTMYLNATWKHPFDHDLTIRSPFTTESGDEMRAPMMQVDLHPPLDFAEGAGWQAVRLPYGGGELAMEVLLPTSGAAPATLLAPAKMREMEEAFAPTSIHLQLPRWDIATHAALKPVLRRLGLQAAFEPHAFQGITTDPRFLLSDVVQEANLTVGERGTEGAAATAMVFETISGDTAPTMHVDSPFAFAVVHRPTGVPLFEGVVGDPSA